MPATRRRKPTCSTTSAFTIIVVATRRWAISARWSLSGAMRAVTLNYLSTSSGTDHFNYAAAKGLCPDNPAAGTIPRIEKKQRKRHTGEGLKAIREKSPTWLQNAIDLALITGQRRSDILSMKFDYIRDGFLYLIQQKTAKVSDAAWIRFQVTPELQDVLDRCNDGIPSPFLIHRRPDRKLGLADRKEHWTKIDERYLSRAFKECAGGCSLLFRMERRRDAGLP